MRTTGRRGRRPRRSPAWPRARTQRASARPCPDAACCCAAAAEAAPVACGVTAPRPVGRVCPPSPPSPPAVHPVRVHLPDRDGPRVANVRRHSVRDGQGATGGPTGTRAGIRGGGAHPHRRRRYGRPRRRPAATVPLPSAGEGRHGTCVPAACGWSRVAAAAGGVPGRLAPAPSCARPHGRRAAGSTERARPHPPPTSPRLACGVRAGGGWRCVAADEHTPPGVSGRERQGQVATAGQTALPARGGGGDAEVPPGRGVG